MNKLMMAMAVIFAVSVAAPAFADINDSGAVGTFTQQQRAPLPN